MPGKLEFEAPGNPWKIREWKAYWEGYQHASDGGLIGDVPFATGTVEKVRWEAGFTAYV